MSTAAPAGATGPDAWQAQRSSVGDSRTLVVAPGRASTFTASAAPEEITIVSVQHGDGVLDMAVSGPSGGAITPVVVTPGGEDTPNGVSIVKLPGTTVLQLRAVPSGDYTVSLTLSPGEQDAVYTQVVTTLVPDERLPPRAYIGGNVKGRTVTLSSAASQDPENPSLVLPARWDLGDGRAATGVRVRHRYAPGRYRAVLTVTNRRGETATTAQVIDLTGKPFLAVRLRPQRRAVAVTFQCTRYATEGCGALVGVAFTTSSGRVLHRQKYLQGASPGSSRRQVVRVPARITTARRVTVVMTGSDSAVRPLRGTTVRASARLR